MTASFLDRQDELAHQRLVEAGLTPDDPATFEIVATETSALVELRRKYTQKAVATRKALNDGEARFLALAGTKSVEDVAREYRKVRETQKCRDLLNGLASSLSTATTRKMSFHERFRRPFVRKLFTDSPTKAAWREGLGCFFAAGGLGLLGITAGAATTGSAVGLGLFSLSSATVLGGFAGIVGPAAVTALANHFGSGRAMHRHNVEPVLRHIERTRERGNTVAEPYRSRVEMIVSLGRTTSMRQPKYIRVLRAAVGDLQASLVVDSAQRFREQVARDRHDRHSAVERLKAEVERADRAITSTDVVLASRRESVESELQRHSFNADLVELTNVAMAQEGVTTGHADTDDVRRLAIKERLLDAREKLGLQGPTIFGQRFDSAHPDQYPLIAAELGKIARDVVVAPERRLEFEADVPVAALG